MGSIGSFELDRVYLGDCIELMKELPDKCVAAIQTGRRFLGFEIDPKYCDLANKRIEAAKAQGRLALES